MIATIGMFDGVHAGHRFLIERLKQASGEDGSLVVTFAEHPLGVIAPGKAPQLLTTATEKEQLLRKCGVDVTMLHFDNELRQLTATQFIKLLSERYGVTRLMLGYDNHIGSDRCSAADLAALMPDAVTECQAAPGKASSSEIRRLLLEGNVVAANELLGYRYTLRSAVVHGSAIGRTLGFPTANIEPMSEKLIPARGVYAAVATTDGGERYRAVVNIGYRPTVNTSATLRVEACLDGFEGDLYGRELSVELCERLRDEQRFDSVEALREAIAADVAAARTLVTNPCNQ